jgi:hypothetical protein
MNIPFIYGLISRVLPINIFEPVIDSFLFDEFGIFFCYLSENFFSITWARVYIYWEVLSIVQPLIEWFRPAAHVFYRNSYVLSWVSSTVMSKACEEKFFLVKLQVQRTMDCTWVAILLLSHCRIATSGIMNDIVPWSMINCDTWGGRLIFMICFQGRGTHDASGYTSY